MKKILWISWLQGLDSAPSIVRACVDRWVNLNPGWDIRVLSMSDVPKHTDLLDRLDLAKKVITPASFSDILRSALLREHGGVWADATTWPNVALDDWLQNVMGEGFFAYRAPAKNRPLSSWFLASEQGNAITESLDRRVGKFWEMRDKAERYYWFHFIFRNMLKQESDIAASWARVPHVSAAESHQFQRYMHLPVRRMKKAVDTSPPVLKLTHRLSRLAPDSILHQFAGLHRWPEHAALGPIDRHPALNLLAPSEALPRE